MSFPCFKPAFLWHQELKGSHEVASWPLMAGSLASAPEALVHQLSGGPEAGPKEAQLERLDGGRG